MGDWTTWDGLNDAPEEAWEEITFGERPVKPTVPKVNVSKPAWKTAGKQAVFAKPQKAITKKRSARASGLMTVVSSPAKEDTEPTKKESEPEVSDSPYIVDSKNPYTVLMEMTEKEEADEAAAAAAAEAAAAECQAAKLMKQQSISEVHALSLSARYHDQCAHELS